MGYIEEASNANDANMAYAEDKAEKLKILEREIMADPASLRDCLGEAVDRMDKIELHRMISTMRDTNLNDSLAVYKASLKFTLFIMEALNEEVKADAYAQWESNYEG
jgi:hypothetical protein